MAKRRIRKKKHSRKALIAALGQEKEGRKSHQKYAFSTREFQDKVYKGTSPASIKARKTLGI
jgi:hypothetical protein